MSSGPGGGEDPPQRLHGRRAAERGLTRHGRARSSTARPIGRHATWHRPDRTAGVLAATTAVVAGSGLAFALVVAGPQRAYAPGEAPAATPASTSAAQAEPTGNAVAAPIAPSTRSRDLGSLQTVLAGRAAAVLAGDQAKWLAPLAEPASEYAKQQARLFGRLRLLPFTSYRYTVLGEIPRDSADAAGLGPTQWVADVRLAYQMSGDGRDVSRRVPLIVAGPPEAPRIIGDAAVTSSSTTMRDLWELSDIAVFHGRHSILIGDQRRAKALRRYAGLVDKAVAAVDKLWGQAWRRTVVVVVPHSVDQMAKVLGRTGTAGLNQLAAVTTGEIDRPEGSRVPVTTADRVVLNPSAFGSSQEDERQPQVVLTHEMAHVATRGSVVIGPPLWLEEAFADFVAYRDSGISRADLAEPLLRDIRAGQGPVGLPDEDAFDPMKTTSVDGAYVASWLALEMIESQHGANGVVAFYRTATGLEAASAGAAMTREAALERAYRRLGTDAATFERQWLAYLSALSQ